MTKVLLCVCVSTRVAQDITAVFDLSGSAPRFSRLRRSTLHCFFEKSNTVHIDNLMQKPTVNFDHKPKTRSV